MTLALREVGASLRLWRIWMRLGLQDLRLRFRRSAIGVGWIFLNLAIMILAIGYIYSHLFGQDLGTFIPYLTVGLIIWGYLTNSIVEGGNAFVNSEGYIKQISLPLYVFVMRSFVTIAVTTAITWAAYVLVALVYRVPFALGTLWAISGILLLVITSLLLITIFAHINARFRDAAHLAIVGMQVLFYVTPVIFPPDLLRQRGLGVVIDANPMYHLLEVVRRPLLQGEPAAGLSYAVAGLVIIVLAGVALAVIGYFRRSIVYSL